MKLSEEEFKGIYKSYKTNENALLIANTFFIFFGSLIDFKVGLLCLISLNCTLLYQSLNTVKKIQLISFVRGKNEKA